MEQLKVENQHRQNQTLALPGHPVVNNGIDFRLVFEAMPGSSLLLNTDDPVFTILAATRHFQDHCASAEEVIGNGFFSSDLLGDINLRSGKDVELFYTFQQVIATNTPREVRVTKAANRLNPASSQRIHINPVPGATGEVAYLICSSENVPEGTAVPPGEHGLPGLQQAYHLLMQAPIAIQVFKGADLVIEVANGPTLELWNKTPDVIGKPLREVLPELNEQGFIDIIQDVMSTGAPHHAYETPVTLMRNVQAEIEYFNFILQPYYNFDHSAIEGVMVVAHEVTRRVTVEKELKDKEQVLNLAVEINDLGIFNVDIKTNTVTCSEKVMQWFGVTSQHQPLEAMIAMAYPDDIPLLMTCLDNTLGNDWSGRHDEVFRIINRSTGNLIYLRSIGKTQYLDGAATTFAGILQDVTREVLAKQKLEESEQQFRSLVESAPFPIGMYVGKEMRIEVANTAILDVWGKGYDVIGKRYAEVLPELGNQQIFQQLNDTLVSGIPFHARHQRVDLEVAGKLKSYYFNYSFTPVYNAAGEVYAVLNTAADVTDLNTALQRVEESEARFRSMAEGTEILIAVADESGRANYFNSAWELLTGRPRESLMSFGWTDLLHPDDLEKYVDNYLQALQKMEPFSSEVRVKNSEGEYRWLLAKGIARFTADNTFAGYTCSFLDITERKLIEKSTRESEEQFRSLADQAPIIVFMADVTGNVLYCNTEWLRFTGQSFEEALGLEGWQRVIHPDDFHHLINEYLGATANRDTYTVEIRMRRWDNHYRYIRYTGGPRYLANGEFAGYIGTGMDTTEQRNAEDALKESERNLRNIILQAPVAMCILRGPEFVVEIANERLFELLGKQPKLIINRSLFSALPETDGEDYEDWLQGVYETGDTFTGNGLPVMLTRNGKTTLFYLNLVFEALREADGSVSGIMAVFNDVTEQVLAHQKIEEVVAIRTRELADANRELQQSNTELNQFAYIASHDLQEPLRKIRTFTDYMQDSLDEIPAVTETYINKIRSSSERMQTLIHDVLAFSLLSKEREEMYPVDLNQTVRNVLSDHELQIDQCNAIISVAQLPTIQAVEFQMNQLFSNLISNALKFNNLKRGLTITIAATTLSDEKVGQHKELLPGRHYHAITVKDNGIGFSQQYAEQIFVIFQRLHGKMEFAGTGIGLAMCKKIATNHHGTIYATSSLNEGAEFTVVLPAG